MDSLYSCAAQKGIEGTLSCQYVLQCLGRVGVNSLCLILSRFVPVATVSGVSCSFM